MMELALGIIVGLIALAGAMVVVLGRHGLHCALGLLANSLALAAFYLLLGAELVAAIQVIVYAGAIVILFLFMVWFLDLKKLERIFWGGWGTGLAAAGVVLLTASVLMIGVAGWWWGIGAPRAFGDNVFPRVGVMLVTGQNLVRLEAVSVLLLAATIGALYLTRTRERKFN